MSITTSQAVSTLENVLFESATLAAANAATANLSSFASVDAYAASLTSSPEFSIVERVITYYQDALGRSPSGAEIGYYVNLAESGSTAAGLAAATPAQIAQGVTGISNSTWGQIAEYFAASPEFQKDYGVQANSVSASGYDALITSLYQNILGRTPAASEVAYYVTALQAGAAPSTLVQWFSASPEFQQDVNGTISSLLVSYNDALQAGGANTGSIGKLPIGSTPSYALARDSQASITEGGTETFLLSTGAVASGTTLYYTLTGVTASEVVGGSLSGTVTVGNNGDATLTVSLTSTAGQGLSGDLTASISTTASGASVASVSVALVETAAPGLVTLGSLAGGSSAGFSINNSGTVVGFAGIGDSATGLFQSRGGSDHAVVWQNGTITDLGLLSGAQQAEAWSINNHGEIVGWSVYIGSAGLSGGHAFIFQNGTLTDLGTMGGSTTSQAKAVNDFGQIVGQSGSLAVLWQPTSTDATTGAFHALGTLDNYQYGMGTGINATGEVVGYVTNLGGTSYEAFLWSPSTANSTTGTMSNLGTAAGQSNPLAVAINNSGEIVGTASDSSGNTVSWVWTPSSANGTTGTMTALAAPTGGTGITATAINDSGLIVGEATVPVVVNGVSETFSHALLWEANGTVVDLNSYLPAGSTWMLNTANAINDHGQIVGGAVDMVKGGGNATYILTLPTATSGAEIELVGVSSASPSHLG